MIPLCRAWVTKVVGSGGSEGAMKLNQKSWTWRGAKQADVDIHKGDGPIRAIAWSGGMIAWSTDNDVKIFDYYRNDRVAMVAKPDNAPHHDACPCRIVWQDESVRACELWLGVEFGAC
jgi:hypothetical protein